MTVQASHSDTSRTSETSGYDAIIIGSGIGGLTAAGLIAGVAGKKVLVLEKHTTPGGLTHVFRRDGAAWDVGLHYVGQMAPGSQFRSLFDYLSGGALQWNAMPDIFERFVYPGISFAVPSDPQRYQKSLVDRFPAEARSIRKYFRDVNAVVRWTTLGFARGMVPGPAEPAVRLVQRLMGGMMGGIATKTTRQYLEGRFDDPLLRAVLASQWGDYGLPPSRSAFAIHAQIVAHYLHGAWFPEGGSNRIARTFEQGIERAGGSIRVGQEAVRILLQDGRAVGVEVNDRRGGDAHRVTYKAPLVISDVGASITFGQLLPQDGPVGNRTAGLRRLIDELGPGLSAVTLYLRLKAPATTLGVHGENFWINTDLDHDAVELHSSELMQGRPARLYASFPSIKSGDERFHTAELISFVEGEAFAAWQGQPEGQHGPAYAALKQCISEGMLRLAETEIAGLTALVQYSELSTPLSVEHFTSHPGGAFYGLPETPKRYRSYLLGPATPIDGLLLTGQDAGCLGIAGAMMAGVGAASQALGPSGYPMIQTALKKGPPLGAPPVLPPGKIAALLTHKQQLTPTIWKMDFELDQDVDGFAPGQFARMQVGDFEWRDYSIAGLHGRSVSFLIGTRTGGHGSQFVLDSEPGTRTVVEGPLGAYQLVRNDHRKVFVATGTGLAPFLPMFPMLEQQAKNVRTELLFGCHTSDEDITRQFEHMPAQVTVCTSRETAVAGGFEGRVTDALAHMAFDMDTTDFYVCGSASMVADVQIALHVRGVRSIYVEPY